MKKTIAVSRPAISSTTKWLVGLTLLYFVAKTLGNR